MGKIALRAVLAVPAMALLQWMAAADGVFFPDEKSYLRYHQRQMINEAEQTAVVVFREGTENLVISPRFSGPYQRFAWIVPVLLRPQISKVDGALFHELAALLTPVWVPMRPGESTRAQKGEDVTVVERKQVGAYEVAVLDARDASALARWLRTNGFAVPSAAQAPIRAHIRERWTFVAARVTIPSAQKALHEGTLPPIRLTFRTKEPVYPLRMSSANPTPFQLEVFLILPPTKERAAPGVNSHTEIGGTSWRWSGTPDPHKMPTLAKLVPDYITLYVTEGLVRPSDCHSDLRYHVVRGRLLRLLHPQR